MCKLIRSKSPALSFAREVAYVTEVFESAPPEPEEKDKRPVRVMMLDAR